MIELCDTLIHFESFRVLNVNTQTMDKAILDLVKELHTIVKEPTQEEKGKLEMNARRESLRSMLVIPSVKLLFSVGCSHFYFRL